MIEIENITDEPMQRHTILLGNAEVVLSLRYLSSQECWMWSVKYKNFELHGMMFALGVLHMVSANQPFDFLIEDTSGQSVDPCALDDFSTGRCKLYMMEPADMIEIRGGAKVPV